MIEHTFQMLPSVGRKKESSLWESGILDWEGFLSNEAVPGIKDASKDRCDAVLMQASELLDDGESRLLGHMVPRGEHWRMYDRFRDGAAYLDIETDGLSRDSLVTVVTVHRRGSTTTLVEGVDLDAGSLSDALEGADVLVTFNGSCFDVPVLKNSFPGVDLDIPHYDLRFASRKLGHKILILLIIFFAKPKIRAFILMLVICVRLFILSRQIQQISLTTASQK